MLRVRRLPRLACADDPPPESWRTTPEATTATPDATCATPVATSATRFRAPRLAVRAFLTVDLRLEDEPLDFRDFAPRRAFEGAALFAFARAPERFFEAAGRPLAADELFRFLLPVFRFAPLRTAMLLLP